MIVLAWCGRMIHVHSRNLDDATVKVSFWCSFFNEAFKSKRHAFYDGQLQGWDCEMDSTFDDLTWSAPGVCIAWVSTFEQCSKPLLVGLYKGLYYPVILGL